MADTVVFIPAWNEERSIPAVLDELRDGLPDVDVLVVDDGSTDGTAEIAREHGAEVLSFGENKGLRTAIAAGYGYAHEHGYAFAGRVDADGQHPVHELSRLLARVKADECDAAFGSRFVAGDGYAEYRYRPSAPRALGTAALRRLMAIRLDRPLADATSGMYAVRAVAMPFLAQPYTSAAPEVEGLIRLSEAGLRIEEVPVDMREREHGESKLRGVMSFKVVFTVVAVVLGGWNLAQAALTYCDEDAAGFGWILDEFMARCSHALVADGRVWLVDALLGDGVEERVRAAGEPAGVIQLLDRHGRDCAEWARRLGVPHHEVPFDGVPDSPFEVIAVRRWRRWQEVALWWPERRVLVCADALGTARYYRAGDEPVGVNPLLRLTPPKALCQTSPETILVGHGEGVHERAREALREAVDTARRRAPALAWSWLRNRRRR